MQDNKNKFAIIIPAFNESTSITKVIIGAESYGSVIVVDDGSTDDTYMLAKNCGVVVVRFEQNKGYDAALNSGIERAIDLNFDFAITIDADGQHELSDIESFKKKLIGGADVVVGERYHKQRLAESIFSLIASSLWGVKDPLCGFKGYRLEKVKLFDRFDTYKSIGTEFLIRSLRSGFLVESLPVSIKKRDGISTFGNGFKANYKIIRAMIIGLILAKKSSRDVCN